MFIFSKRNFILPSLDGSTSVRVKRDFVGDIPDWAAETPYFQSLVADGKIIPTSKRDADTQAAAEKKVKTRRGKEVTEE